VLRRIVGAARVPWAGDHQDDRGCRGGYWSQDSPRNLSGWEVRLALAVSPLGSVWLEDLCDRYELVPALCASGQVQLHLALFIGQQLVAEKRDQVVLAQVSGSVVAH
jgi:hypothetical protein